jgi:hypothetical protein
VNIISENIYTKSFCSNEMNATERGSPVGDVLDEVKTNFKFA